MNLLSDRWGTLAIPYTGRALLPKLAAGWFKRGWVRKYSRPYYVKSYIILKDFGYTCLFLNKTKKKQEPTSKRKHRKFTLSDLSTIVS